MNSKKFKNRAGFTLIELIVVIAIMAILAGVAVPVYSGYIEKAEKAADLQLLGAVNSAFAASVVEQGGDPRQLSGASATISSGKVTSVSASNVEGNLNVQDAFNRYFAGNTEAQFKVITLLTYNYADGVFGEASETMQNLLATLLKENGGDITKLNASTFGDMGAGNLMNEVDFVTDLATEMLKNSPNGKFADIIKSEDYGKALAAAMGYDRDDPEEEKQFQAALKELAIQKATELQEQNPDKYANQKPTFAGSQVYKDALNSIYANNAVLYAAQNSQSASSSILTTLGGEGASGVITSALSGTNSKDGLAQAAMAYGLYTAYANRNGKEVPSNPADVLSALDTDAGFKAYINGEGDNAGLAQKDLDGYMAAMNMVNTSTNDKEAVSDVLVNGFTDPNLVSLLQSAMNSATAE